MTAPVNSISSNDVLDLLNTVQGASTLAVPTTGVVYGKSFALKKNKSYGLLAKFSSPGVVTVKIELEEGNAPPATEGSADTSWAVGTIIEAAVVSTAAIARAVSPVVAKFARLKLTGSGSNDASTALAQAQLGISENL